MGSATSGVSLSSGNSSGSSAMSSSATSSSATSSSVTSCSATSSSATSSSATSRGGVNGGSSAFWSMLSLRAALSLSVPLLLSLLSVSLVHNYYVITLKISTYGQKYCRCTIINISNTASIPSTTR